jgi:putative membrane protein insertion efficiency factor
MKTLLLMLVRAYQLGVSPFLGQNCRFYPSCSNYAVEAIREYGAFKGSLLATRRLCKCHPWHPGGLDPVPKKSSSEAAPTTACGCGHSEFLITD